MVHRRRFSHESLLFFWLFFFFFFFSVFFPSFLPLLLAFLPLFYLSFFFLFLVGAGYFAALNTPRFGRAIAAQYARLARYVLVSLRAYARLLPAVVNSQILTLRLRVVHVAHFWRTRAILRFAPRIHSLSSTAKRVAKTQKFP